MNRREFIQTTSAAFFSTMLAGSIKAMDIELPIDIAGWKPGDPRSKSGPAPLPEITAAVDVLVPPDPDIPGDFKGSDYGGDWVVAAQLENLGQYAVVIFLNVHARKVAGKKFINCTADEQMEAIKSWIKTRDDMLPLLKEMMTGLLSMSVIGTFEENSPEETTALFTSMGWFDPKDPAGTFRLPNEGYPDSFQFPARLRKGMKK